MTDQKTDPTTPAPGAPNAPAAQARPAAPAPARPAAATGRKGPAPADPIDLAGAIRKHLKPVPDAQRSAVADALRAVLTDTTNLAALRDLDKLGPIDGARWDQSLAWARVALGS